MLGTVAILCRYRMSLFGKYFSSLEEVCQYIRGHGLVGVNESTIKAEKDILDILLWASLSELPRQEMTSAPITKEAPPTKTKNVKAATTTKNTKGVAKETGTNAAEKQNSMEQKNDPAHEENNRNETSEVNKMSISIKFLPLFQNRKQIWETVFHLFRCIILLWTAHWATVTCM